ncbi:metallophosphatase family protein [Candidatus Woesearchaeota archaeon]|nr:metallophosphatase family protein [Candidatus Woesearchaeota archaeon]MBW3021565.1 metallophosphatase family protein [Candidatus Woesearchaeota archaeon]
MRLAIISDIHGNFEALIAVISDIENQNVDKIWCAGDLVDYGPEPVEVVEFFMKNKIPCVLGNHEAALFDDSIHIRWSGTAFESLGVTRGYLEDYHLRYLKSLPTYILEGDVILSHGTPGSPHKYIDMLPVELLNQYLSRHRLIFVGHTHLLQYFDRSWKFLDTKVKVKNAIVNVGSVGQPRDDDKRAKYVIYDSSDSTVEPRFVEYDVDKVVEMIFDRGYPEGCAGYLRG